MYGDTLKNEYSFLCYFILFSFGSFSFAWTNPELYCEETTCIRIENELCSYEKIKKRVVKQGCADISDLFSYYSYPIQKTLRWFINFNIIYGNDTEVSLTRKEQLQHILDMVIKESEKKWVEINCKKTKKLRTSAWGKKSPG